MSHLIAAPLKAAIRLLAFAEKLIASVLSAVLHLFGMQMPAARRVLPARTTTASNILAEIQRSAPSIDNGYPTRMKPTTDAGHALYRYACAKSTVERAAVDLSALTHEQQEWLYRLSEANLERLVKVGLDGCTLAMNGKHCGVGGLPAMRNEKAKENPQPSSPLATRIQAHRTQLQPV